MARKRPPKRSEKVSLRLRKSMWDDYEFLAGKEDSSLNKVIERALAQYLERFESDLPSRRTPPEAGKQEMPPRAIGGPGVSRKKFKTRRKRTQRLLVLTR